MYFFNESPALSRLVCHRSRLSARLYRFLKGDLMNAGENSWKALDMICAMSMIEYDDSGMRFPRSLPVSVAIPSKCFRFAFALRPISAHLLRVAKKCFYTHHPSSTLLLSRWGTSLAFETGTCSSRFQYSSSTFIG